ncbi:MAG TPA: hypothetical protein VM240_14425 [Verrucomicrobiae bacterium]|nr:hypothetical protein [Verrucomicrobiae bacterium]
MKHAPLFALLFTPTLAVAQDWGPVTVDPYYVPRAEVEFRADGGPSFDEGGDGYGVKAMARIMGPFVATGEYHSVSYDEASDYDRDDFRVGAGVVGASNSGLYTEYISSELGDGFGAHVRLAGGNERASLHAQLGFVQVEDQDRFYGGEINFGAAYQFTDLLGTFVDYRLTNFEGHDSDVQLKFRDLRVGVRLTFGGVASMPAEDDSVGVETVGEEPGPVEEPAELPADTAPANDPNVPEAAVPGGG